MNAKTICATLVVLLAIFTWVQAEKKLTHDEAIKRFNKTGITVSSSGNCTNRNSRSCTSLEQVNEKTVVGLEYLRNESSCPVRVTAGTEVGHHDFFYSHWNGYKADVALEDGCLENFIRSCFDPDGKRGDGAIKYRSPNNNIYAKEGNHWDITFYN